MRSSGNSGDDSDVAFPSFSSAPTSIGPGAVTKYKPRTDHHKSRHHHKPHRSSSSRKSRRHHDDRELHRLERSHKEQKRARIEELVSEQNQHEIWQQLVEDRLISVDTSGDANLRLFQQSSGPGAPRFTRRGIRLVLGQGRRLRIESSSKDSPDIRLVDPINVSVRYTDIDWVLHDRETERIVQQEHDTQMLQAGFVPIETEVGRGSAGAESKYDSDDESGKNPDFRSLEGMKGKSTTITRNSHVNEEDEISANTTLRDDRIHATTAALESRISANKQDVEAWLQLIAHQEAIVQATFGGKDMRNKSRTKRAIAEVQIEMYRRALRSNPSSQKLILGYLSQCAETMDDDLLIIEWESAAESTSDPHIILRHVYFCQSLASRFSVPWMVDIYAVSIRRIVRCGIRDKTNREASEIGIAVMELIHSVCLFFREAGFWEHALALYQAAVEWYVMTLPEKQRLSFSHRIQAFRAFWDSGRPRVGANAACGWCNSNPDDVCEGAGILEEPALDAVNLSDIDNLRAPNTTSTSLDLWYYAEISQSRLAVEAHAISANELSEKQLQSMDPFSIVVFEDVEPFLVDLKWSQVAAETLVDGFLQFLGAVGPYTFTLTHTYRTQKFLSRSELAWTVPWFGEELLPTVDTLSRHSQSTDKQKKPIIPPPFVVVPLGLDTPDTPLPYSHTCPWHRPTNAVYQRVAGNALFQLQKLSSLSQHSRLQLSTALLEYAFASWSPEYGKKVSRELLAQHPTCLALWNSLAKMQARNNMWDEARRIWARAIRLADTLPVVEHPWIVVLCKSWAELEILHGRGLAIGIRIIAAIASKNVEHILELAAGNSHSPAEDVWTADLLAAQRIIAEYTQECEDSSNENVSEINHAISTLRIWLAYAASGSDGAQNTADALGENAATDNEDLAMKICTVHFYHAKTSRVYRAADLRRQVQRSLEAFPHNSVFWEMLLFSEQRACIANRVNRQLTDVLLAHPDGELADVLLLRAFIAANCRNDQSPNINSVRWALRRATREGVGVSLLVWAVSIAFECQQGYFKRAKRLLLSALRNCPWAKPLYMAALGETKLAFSESEKQALLRAMIRAGIRTHASLAEL